MPSLKEIKTRIGSVSGTLKITSAMKMVASAKLHKAQQAVQGMLPYQQALRRMLSTLAAGSSPSSIPELSFRAGEGISPRIALIAVSSNSSLCGGFNANVVRRVLETLKEYRAAGNITVFPIGRKMADAMRKIGRPAVPDSVSVIPDSFRDLHDLIDSPSYDSAAAFAGAVLELFEAGRFTRVELIYNHFVSTSRQVPERELWLPFDLSVSAQPGHSGLVPESSDRLWLTEPSREELLSRLLPKLMRLKIYTMLLDSAAAEHAARTVAMQTATDNGEDILSELTLEYNKGRQQKITSEILDLAGGALQ